MLVYWHQVKGGEILYHIFRVLKQYQELEIKKGFEESLSGRFFRSGKVDTWKNVLSKNHVSKIENKFGDVMKELGYL